MADSGAAVLAPALLPLQPTNRPSRGLSKKMLAPQLGRTVQASTNNLSNGYLTTVLAQGSPRRHKLSHLASFQLFSVSEEHQRLQRQYQELVHRYRDLVAQYRALERAHEAQAVSHAEERSRLDEEMNYYKTLIELLQAQIAADDTSLPSYTKLLREYKALQLDYEVEKNSKLVLIDQIEFLSKENEALQLQTESDLFDPTLFQFPGPSPRALALALAGALANNTPRGKGPDPRKRASLPASHKLQASPRPDDFVLLPLKLDPSQKRMLVLLTRALHNRYSSHDIIPIQVEFGQATNPRDSAFDTLNGGLAPALPSTPNPSQLLSKRSSLEDSVATRQEVMKLRFELQLLRLHNEKLLLYIGYELQRQGLPLPEYLDLKLIERSRDELIRKKRVLRLVLINPIVQKAKIDVLARGIMPLAEDDYGFMCESGEFSKRVFSNGLQDYYDLNELDGDEPVLRKHKLLVFHPSAELEEDDFEDDDTVLSDHYDEATGVFALFKYLMLGLLAKHQKNDELVDDGLKYKFVTIALGIMIIGLQLSHNRNH